MGRQYRKKVVVQDDDDEEQPSTAGPAPSLRYVLTAIGCGHGERQDAIAQALPTAGVTRDSHAPFQREGSQTAVGTRFGSRSATCWLTSKAETR
jgi:hypothetical protein